MATTLRTDADIQRDVLAELKWDTRVGPNEIGVIVKEGVVTLTGWVDSYTKKWAAREAALRVDGVKAVADEIEVRLPSSAQRTDTDIAAAARRALEADADVPVEKIDARGDVARETATHCHAVWTLQLQERTVWGLRAVPAVDQPLDER
jgi:osmotically-inducible protein OsmY